MGAVYDAWQKKWRKTMQTTEPMKETTDKEEQTAGNGETRGRWPNKTSPKKERPLKKKTAKMSRTIKIQPGNKTKKRKPSVWIHWNETRTKARNWWRKKVQMIKRFAPRPDGWVPGITGHWSLCNLQRRYNGWKEKNTMGLTGDRGRKKKGL